MDKFLLGSFHLFGPCWVKRAFDLHDAECEWKKRATFFLLLSQCTVFISSDSMMEMSTGTTTGKNSNDHRLDCLCTCMRVSVCMCVCVLRRHGLSIHTAHAQSSTRRPGNEAACLLCTTSHTQVWQAMKHTSAFNIQLHCFSLFKATHRSPQTTWSSDYSSNWKPREMSDISLSAKAQTEYKYWRMATEGESWLTDMVIFPKLYKYMYIYMDIQVYPKDA